MGKCKLTICYGITLIVTAVMVLWAMIFPITGNEMGYCILNYYIIFPLVTLISGFIIGTDKSRYKWCYLPFVWMLGLLMPIPVFHNIQFSAAFTGMVPALLGLLTGMLVRKKDKSL